MLKVCKHCGLTEHQHHEYEPTMPDGCVCNPWEWGDDVRPPCSNYQGDGKSYCAECEHDKACHKEAAIQADMLTERAA